MVLGVGAPAVRASPQYLSLIREADSPVLAWSPRCRASVVPVCSLKHGWVLESSWSSTHGRILSDGAAAATGKASSEARGKANINKRPVCYQGALTTTGVRLLASVTSIGIVLQVRPLLGHASLCEVAIETIT